MGKLKEKRLDGIIGRYKGSHEISKIKASTLKQGQEGKEERSRRRERERERDGGNSLPRRKRKRKGKSERGGKTVTVSEGGRDSREMGSKCGFLSELTSLSPCIHTIVAVLLYTEYDVMIYIILLIKLYIIRSIDLLNQ